MSKSNKSGFFKKYLFFFLVLAFAFCIFFYFKDTSGPNIMLMPEAQFVTAKTVFTVKAEDSAGIKILRVYAGTPQQLVKEQYFTRPAKASLSFTLGEISLADGTVPIVVQATDSSLYHFGKGNITKKEHTVTLDTKKPALYIKSSQHNIVQGGAGAITFSVREPLKKAAVKVQSYTFPAYEIKKGHYICLFAFPYDMKKADFNPVLQAYDLAGNMTEAHFPFYARTKAFRSDTLNVSSGFLKAKMGQFVDMYPNEKDLLQLYLKVNNVERKKNRADLYALGQKSAPVPLWKGDFVRLPRAANKARYADHRTYRYEGKEVGRQTHLGLDLASVQRAEVPAGNAGKIVRVGFHGIYGHNVVIDHGLGLMTLYAHLSFIAVEAGEMVEKGQIIGRTGATGLAGGDHLHLGVYISGVAVNPIEWWDKNWLANNIEDRLLP